MCMYCVYRVYVHVVDLLFAYVYCTSLLTQVYSVLTGCKPQSVIWREASPDWISPGISLPSIFIPLLLLHPPLPSHPQCLHHTLTVQDATATTRLRPLSHLHPLHPHQILEPPSSQENGLLGPVLQEGVYDRSPEDQGPV